MKKIIAILFLFVCLGTASSSITKDYSWSSLWEKTKELPGWITDKFEDAWTKAADILHLHVKATDKVNEIKKEHLDAAKNSSLHPDDDQAKSHEEKLAKHIEHLKSVLKPHLEIMKEHLAKVKGKIDEATIAKTNAEKIIHAKALQKLKEMGIKEPKPVSPASPKTTLQSLKEKAAKSTISIKEPNKK